MTLPYKELQLIKVGIHIKEKFQSFEGDTMQSITTV